MITLSATLSVLWFMSGHTQPFDGLDKIATLLVQVVRVHPQIASTHKHNTKAKATHSTCPEGRESSCQQTQTQQNLHVLFDATFDTRLFRMSVRTMTIIIGELDIDAQYTCDCSVVTLNYPARSSMSITDGDSYIVAVVMALHCWARYHRSIVHSK